MDDRLDGLQDVQRRDGTTEKDAQLGQVRPTKRKEPSKSWCNSLQNDQDDLDRSNDGKQGKHAGILPPSEKVPVPPSARLITNGPVNKPSFLLHVGFYVIDLYSVFFFIITGNNPVMTGTPPFSGLLVRRPAAVSVLYRRIDRKTARPLKRCGARGKPD
jgi:hypothetical protein